jgi:hypothetical protein
LAKWFLLTPLLLFIFFGIRVYIHTGFYKEVLIQEPAAHSMHLVYKRHNGAYHKIDSVINEVTDLLKPLNVILVLGVF